VPPRVEVADAERESWERELSASLGCAVELRWSRGRTQVVRMRRSTGPAGEPRIELALAGFFRAAPADVRAAVAAWIRSGRRARQACRRLDEWADEQLKLLPARRGTPQRMRARGAVHDLDELARELHAQGHLSGLLEPTATPPLTFGRAAGSRARRSIRLGSCSPRADLIRIHPVLDQPAVPRAFVRAIVFHELLHVAFPTERDARGRRVHHGPRFRRAERAFADHAVAREWERANLSALIRSARTGKPLAAQGAARTGPPRRAESSGAGLRRFVQRLLFGT